MRILVTNDDGIGAPGLRALVEALSEVGEVTVVAPAREQSCAGHAITLHKPLRLDPVCLDGLPVRALACSGTPADCVVLGRYRETAPPDLVVSGINAGANLGEEVFYSGTVAGAMEGCIQGLRSFAISVTAYTNCDFRAGAAAAAALARVYTRMPFPPGVFLNVNVPNLPPEQVRGWRTTRLGRRAYENSVHERDDPRGRAYYWISGEAVEVDSGEGTDIHAISNGMISVTPVLFDLTGYNHMAQVDALLRQVAQECPGGAAGPGHRL